MKMKKSSKSLNDMPAELLIHIMSYLNFNDLFRMERVSRRMFSVAKTAWKLVHTISTGNIYYSKHQCPDNIDDRMIKNSIKRGNIKSLEAGSPIRICDITSDILSVAKFMPNLQRISLESITLTHFDITALAKDCSQLTHVTFKRCFYVDGINESLRNFFINCSNLLFVDLSFNYAVYEDALLFLPLTVLHLNISMNSCTKRSTMLSIVQTCPNLLSFSFDIYGYASFEINDVLRFLPKVRNLGIYNLCAGIVTDTSIDFSLTRNIETLHVFDNNYINSETLKSLAKCKNLRSLIFQDCSSLTSDALRSLDKCKSLRVLYLTNNNVDVYDLSDVSHVVRSCGIQFFCLGHYGKLPRKDIAKFIDKTPTLKRLHSWIKTPQGFKFEEFIFQYFACKSQSYGVRNDKDPPLFHRSLDNYDSNVDFFVRQSELERSTYLSKDFELTNKKLFEFGILT